MIQLKKNQLIFKKRKKGKLRFVFTILTSFISFITCAQQIPHYTQYMYNMQVLNPAYVGARADLSLSVLSRQQWVGVEGAPTTHTFSINGRKARELVGLGLTIVNDKIGLTEITNVNMDVSYTIETSEYERFALGLKSGFTSFNNNLFQAVTPDNNTNASISGDYPNIGFGGLYYNEKFFVGFSLPYLLKRPLFKIDQSSDKTGLADNFNYFLSADALFELSDDILFKPSTLIKYASNLPISIDFNANFLYKKIIETGFSYRYKNSTSVLFAIIINESFRIGYTYDYNLANFGNINTHEIMLHIDFSFKRNNRWLFNNSCYF